MSSNPELKLAHEFIQHTDCNVFLTGRAGTGKTTFLHQLKGATPKRMIITAPTGVAAINAGGVTLHSFFQLDFGPFLPGWEHEERLLLRRFSREKKNVIKNLDLLVIDEISMVRADLLDGVDAVLRRFRRNERPFGGVQLLMIGDLHQLPPVVKEEERSLLRPHYQSVYFFASQALARTELVPIELRHIYRQSDPDFIELLNQVRDRTLDQQALHRLNIRCHRQLAPEEQEGYITLCTHNRQAEIINQSKLAALPGKGRKFGAEVTGEFPEYSYPTTAELELKVGVQVMFVRNDPSPEKLFFNGKLGRVTRFGSNSICVKCAGEARVIEVERVAWENIKYSLNPETKEIEANKIGEFVQYPLKLAWAITIHKSQGLTFERAIIDAGSAFAHGQIYVALSRCKTLDGLVLGAPIPLQAVKTDPVILEFTGKGNRNPTPEKFETARISYQQRLLRECFDFRRLRSRLGRLVGIVVGNARTVQLRGSEAELRETEKKAVAEICTVAENFRLQLDRFFAADRLPAADGAVLERLSKAADYFGDKLGAVAEFFGTGLRVETDNKELRQKIREGRQQLEGEIAIKLAAVKSCRTGFSPAAYLAAITSAEIDRQTVREDKGRVAGRLSSDASHPELVQILKDWRAAKAAAEGIDHYRVLHQRVLFEIAARLPGNPAVLGTIKGIGKRTLEKYGQELVALVVDYRRRNQIEEAPLPESAPDQEAAGQKERAPGSDTRQVSLELLQAGLTIAQIAQRRGLTVSTIEGHLAFQVQAGRAAIRRLMPPEKIEVIEQVLAKLKARSLGEIKRALGDDHSYGEIKLVQAHLKYLEGNREESSQPVGF